jgi:uncharacterized protein (TIGR02145 family)
MKKAFISLILLVLYCFVTHDSLAQKCTDGNCKDGFGTYTYKNGDSYTGNFKGGLRNGEGTFTWANGNKYIGEYLDGFRNGKGTFTWADGNKYTGQYKDGLRNGQGTEYYANGEAYAGNWQDDKINGQGTFFYKDGSKYTGEFLEGIKSGQGSYYFTNGGVYSGKWRNDIMSGKGIYHAPDSSKYAGKYKNGLKCGKGTYYFANNEIYEGKWKNDKMNGCGTYYYTDNTEIVGKWKDGEMVSGIKKDSENKAQAKVKEKAGNKDNAKAEAKVKQKPKNKDKGKAEAKVKDKPKSKDKGKAEARVKDKTKSKDKGKAEARVKDKTKNKCKAKAEARAKDNSKNKCKAKAEARAKDKTKNEDQVKVEPANAHVTAFTNKALVNVDPACNWHNAGVGIPVTVIYKLTGPEAETVRINAEILSVSNTETGIAKSLVLGSNSDKTAEISGATISEVSDKKGDVQLKIVKDKEDIMRASGVSGTNQAGNYLFDPRDEKEYRTIKIGGQLWMAENLNYETKKSWRNPFETYGRLYTYDEAQNVCPSGWHLPSDTDWKQMTDLLGGNDLAGGKMKEPGLEHWKSPNSGADNASGFMGLPGGCYLYNYTSITNIGDHGCWWSSTGYDAFYASRVSLAYDQAKIYYDRQLKRSGFSVRCVKD